MQKCNRTSYAKKRAAGTHITCTFQNTFCTHAHMCDHKLHVCMPARTFATHPLTYSTYYIWQTATGWNWKSFLRFSQNQQKTMSRFDAWTLKSTPLWRPFWSDRIFKKKKCTSACAVRIEACIHSVLHFKVLLFSYLLSNRVKQTAKFPKYWRNDTFSIGTINILRQNNFGLFLTHPLWIYQHKYSTERQQNWPFSRPTHQGFFWRRS